MEMEKSFFHFFGSLVAAIRKIPAPYSLSVIFFNLQLFTVIMIFLSSLPFVRPVNASSQVDKQITNYNFLLFLFCRAGYAPPILTIVLLLLSSLSAMSQVTEEWVGKISNPAGADAGDYMVLDNEGNVYVTGRSWGNGAWDYLTVKFNASGEEQWTARYDGPIGENDIPTAITVDKEGNVYVTGKSTNYDKDKRLKKYDYATLKYNNNGEEQWVRRYKGPGDREIDEDIAHDISVDNDGNVYVVGEAGGDLDLATDVRLFITIKYSSTGEELWLANYRGPVSIIDDGARAIEIDAEGNLYVTGFSRREDRKGNEYATVKYNNMGEEQWVSRFSFPEGGFHYANAIALDDKGNVYVSGKFALEGKVFDVATVKYNDKGEEQWVATYKSNFYRNSVVSDPVLVDLGVDAEGNVYITCPSNEDGPESNYATVKYNNKGEEQWVKKYNGPGNGEDVAYSLAVGSDGGIYVTGSSMGNRPKSDVATIKYDTEGNEQWVARYHGAGDGANAGRSIATDAEGNIFVAGNSSGLESGADLTVIKYKEEPGITAPVELTANGVSDSQINLSWQANAEDIDGFVLERATNPDFTGSVAYIRLAADRTSYEDKNKSTDVTFYYRIKAVQEDTSSDYSTVVSAAATKESANQPPVVDAGEDKTISLPVDSVSFTATASDPDGEIVSYLWEQLEGPSANLKGADTNTLILTGLKEGSYTFEVTVTDDKGDTASDEVKLTINPESDENMPPVAHAGEDQTVTAGSDGTASVTLDGSASSDPDGSINRYEWAKDGEEFMKGIKPTVSLPVGIHTITLTVYDNEWVTDTDEVVITVNEASDFAAPANLMARSVSDSQINLSWQEYGAEEDGFVLERATNSHFTGSVAHIKLPAGRTSYEDGNKATDVTFYYRLKAVKGEDASPYSNIASATAGSPAEQTGPLANAGEDQTVTAGEDGKASVTLDGSASTASEGSIANYRWTLAGEEIATGIQPTVKLGVGTHNIALTVTDHEGNTDSDEVTIRVQDAEAELAAPAHLSAEAASASQINLSWKNHAPEHDGFVLERATNPGFTGSVAYISIPANRTSYEDKNKTTDVTFYYRVKAVKGDNSSEYSNIASAAASHTAGASMRLAGSADAGVEGLAEAELQVYPNPMQQEFTLKLHNDYEGPVRLMLFDMTGRILMEEDFEKTSPEHAEKLGISGLSLPDGVYFLKLSGEGMGERTIRLVKE